MPSSAQASYKLVYAAATFLTLMLILIIFPLMLTLIIFTFVNNLTTFVTIWSDLVIVNLHCSYCYNVLPFVNFSWDLLTYVIVFTRLSCFNVKTNYFIPILLSNNILMLLNYCKCCLIDQRESWWSLGIDIFCPVSTGLGLDIQ